MEEKTSFTEKEEKRAVWKRKLSAAGKGVKKTFHIFPVTQGSIWLFTILFAVLTGCSDSVMMDVGERVLFFLLFFGTGSFFSEAVYRKTEKMRLRVFLYAAALLPALLFSWLLALEPGSAVWRWDADLIGSYLPRYIICYELVLFILAVYFCFCSSRLSLEEYITRIFAWAVRVSVLYVVLIIGVSTVVGIFDELFEAGYEIYFQFQILLFGIFYISSLLKVMLPEAEEEGHFTEGLVKYVLTGLLISAFAIVYIYILKILLFRDMPSNAVFRILTGLFLTGVPIWTMNSFYTRQNPLLKISRILPYLFSPLILLQGYSIGVRIYENGITPMRYVGILLLVFEILYVLLYFFRRQAISRLFVVLACFVLVACCLPGINMYHVSYLNQKSALERFLNRQDTSSLSRRELDQAAGAYRYLCEDQKGSGYLAALPEEMTEKLENMQGDSSGYRKTYDIYQSKKFTVLDVAGYQSCYPVKVSRRDAGEIETMTEYKLTYGEEETVFFDLKGYLDGFLGMEDDNGAIDQYFLSHRIFDLNADTRLCLDYLSFDYDLTTGEYTSFSFGGYLLVK